MDLAHQKTPHQPQAAGSTPVTEAEFLRLAELAGIDERTRRCIVQVMRLGDRRHVIGGVMYELVEAS
jgi:hypothetical protein